MYAWQVVHCKHAVTFWIVCVYRMLLKEPQYIEVYAELEIRIKKSSPGNIYIYIYCGWTLIIFLFCNDTIHIVYIKSICWIFSKMAYSVFYNEGLIESHQRLLAMWCNSLYCLYFIAVFRIWLMAFAIYVRHHNLTLCWSSFIILQA